MLQGRMRGGTDVALAIQIASEHMRTALPARGLKTLVILSDGRIDKYQGDDLSQSHCTDMHESMLGLHILAD